jgi:predicted GTPase
VKRSSPAPLSVLPAFSTSIFIVVVSALQAGQEGGLQLGPGTLEKVDEVAVVANASLEEAVVNIVLEVHGLAVRRVLITRTVQVGHARDVLGEDGRQPMETVSALSGGKA